MRTLTLPLIVAALPVFATGPEQRMLVVVHTADRVVVDYVCNQFLSERDPTVPIYKSVIQAEGMFNWHVVGGIAPYTVVRNPESVGEGCITVMDAEGNTATGCGVVGVERVRREVDCGSFRPDPLLKDCTGDNSVMTAQPIINCPEPPPPKPSGRPHKRPKTPPPGHGRVTAFRPTAKPGPVNPAPGGDTQHKAGPVTFTPVQGRPAQH